MVARFMGKQIERVALVTGANRGIGLEVCRQLAKKGVRVVLTARRGAEGRAAAESLKGEDLRVQFMQLDVTDEKAPARIAKDLESEFGRFDILINNAGIMPHQEAGDKKAGSRVLTSGVDNIRRGMETNFYGPLRICQALAPLMQKNRYGRIVNVSTGMAQLSDMNGGYPGYRASKVALNSLTRMLADELKGTNILVNSVCPGWVKTDMGGSGAERSVEKGAETIVWLALLPDRGPSGGFFRDKRKIPW